MINGPEPYAVSDFALPVWSAWSPTEGFYREVPHDHDALAFADRSATSRTRV